MAYFFFDLQDDEDVVGMDLPDMDAARQAAVRYAGDILREAFVDTGNSFYWRMDVRRARGPVLFSLVLDLVPVPAGAIQHGVAQAANDRADDVSDQGWHLV